MRRFLLLPMAPAQRASCEAARRFGRLCALLHGLSVARVGAAGCALSSGRAASANAAEVEDGLAREDCDEFVDQRIADKGLVVVVLVSRIAQERGELLTSGERV